MRHKGVVTAAVTTVLALSFVLMAAQGAASTPGVSGTHVSLTKLPSGAGSLAYRSPFTAETLKSASTPKTLCSALPSGDDAAGIYAITISEAFVLDWATGNLTLCAAGVDSVIQAVPSAVAGYGYYGIDGTNVSGTLNLLLLSWGVEGGWYCLNATTSGCASTSYFTLPSTFCSAQPAGYCNPDGVVLARPPTYPSTFCSAQPAGYCNPDGVVLARPDGYYLFGQLAFTYVDIVNKDMVTCTGYATSCMTDKASSAFAGFSPIDIFKEGHKFYVSDNSCTGKVWVGTIYKMKVLYTEGNSLEGIAFHEHTLYVGDDAYCGGVAGILNAKTGVELPTIFTGPVEIIGLDWDLQFTTYSPGAVYLQ